MLLDGAGLSYDVASPAWFASVEPQSSAVAASVSTSLGTAAFPGSQAEGEAVPMGPLQFPGPMITNPVQWVVRLSETTTAELKSL